MKMTIEKNNLKFFKIIFLWKEGKKRMKIKYFIIPILSFIGIFLSNEKVSATTYESLTIEHQENVYYAMTGDDGYFSADPYAYYTMNGKTVYCVEQGVPIHTSSYLGTEGFSSSPFDFDTNRRIELIGHYGYDYPGHQTQHYRMATQALIWETITGYNVNFYTENYAWGDYIDVSYEREQIMNLVNNHLIKPSFDAQTFNINFNETIEIEDFNNKLSEFQIFDSNNNDVRIENNKVFITAKSVGQSEISFIKKYYDNSTTFFYRADDGVSQKLAFFRTKDPVLTYLNINVVAGKIKVRKQDSDTNSCKSQGQTSLIGAKYGVYDSNNNLVDTLTIGNDCTVTSKELPYGTYKIRELSAPQGYELDPKTYTAIINSTNVVEVVLKENVIKNHISILKQYDYVDGNTTFLSAEANVTFEIYNQDNTLYATIVTDKNGYASLDIPYGVWRFHQVNTHIGFEKIYDFYITVNEDSEKEQYYNILNNKLSAYLKVVKIDSETGNTIAIADTIFKILNIDTNQYVSQYVAGKVYDTFKTDSDGVMTTYLKLDAGNYKLIEVSSPHNYLINTDGLEFSIGEDTYYNYTTYGAFVTVYFDNQVIKGQIEINKNGEDVVIENGNFTYKQKPLENVVFEIYANEDILSADGNTLYYEKDQLVDTITTNENGYAISKELYLGSYYIVETKTNDDYVLDTKKYEFTLTEKDNKTPIVYHNYSALNVLKKSKLEFTKTDVATGKGIPDTKVEIYHLKDDGISELIFTGITDSDGKIIITDLFIGKFAIIETDSATGYKLSDEIVSFEIKDNGEIVKANMTNEKIKSVIKIHKVDEDNNSLAGVEIGIFDLDGNLLNSYITDENGDIEVELEYGSYYFQEIKNIDGYILNDEKVYFDINKDGEYIQYTLVNETETIEVPNTKLNDCKTLDIIGLILIIAGVSYIIYDKKREK